MIDNRYQMPEIHKVGISIPFFDKRWDAVSEVDYYDQLDRVFP